MVVTEGQKDWWAKRAHSLGVAGIANGYFNSGFLLINTNQWTNERVSARAIAMLSDPEIVKKITHPDQDVLNMLLADKLVYADIKYNTQFSLNYQLKESFKNPVTNDTVLFIILVQLNPGMTGPGIIQYHKLLWRQKMLHHGRILRY